LVWGCPTADSGGEGAVGGIPQLLSGLVVVGNPEMGLLLSGKVQPSLVSFVAVVDILLILGGRFLRVLLVELVDEVG